MAADGMVIVRSAKCRVLTLPVVYVLCSYY